MPELTTQQMLTEIVQRGIDNGAYDKQWHEAEIVNIRDYMIDIAFFYNGSLSIGGYPGEPPCADEQTFSLADLVNDGAFMAVVFGKDIGIAHIGLCNWMCKKDSCDDKDGLCKLCTNMMPRYEHIQQRAIIIDNPQEQIRFLYESMPKEEG
jgi:hypothetical protein